MTDSLSKALQIEVSAVSGQHVDSLIQSMRSDSDFDLFYQTVKKQKELIIYEPDSIQPHYLITVKEHFKVIYFETIDKRRKLPEGGV